MIVTIAMNHWGCSELPCLPDSLLPPSVTLVVSCGTSVNLAATKIDAAILQLCWIIIHLFQSATSVKIQDFNETLETWRLNKWAQHCSRCTRVNKAGSIEEGKKAQQRFPNIPSRCFQELWMHINLGLVSIKAIKTCRTSCEPAKRQHK